MILKVHVDGAPSYEIGDEIWQESLADAIRKEAQVIADHLGGPHVGSARQLLEAVDEMIIAMTAALIQVGDAYQAPDGVVYSLIEPPAHEDDGVDMVNL
jgi:hypothetical protein